VRALARERVQIERHGRGQGLALAGCHLSDLTPVQDDSSDQLHIEWDHIPGRGKPDDIPALPHEPTAGLPDDGEGLVHQVIESLAVGQT
jgi:hypothetical protein